VPGAFLLLAVCFEEEEEVDFTGLSASNTGVL
jgi:hypothetical protein